uniref:PRC-barrel domain-containing protein n=1 Tax=Deinococcus sp. TaxID=47478 RepID=UPI00345CCC75
VLNEAGEELGRVKDVLDMGHQDLLLVETPSHEAYVPLQAPYVLVEPPARKPQRILLTADAPAGLLDEGEDVGAEPLEPTED